MHRRIRLQTTAGFPPHRHARTTCTISNDFPLVTRVSAQSKPVADYLPPINALSAIWSGFSNSLIRSDET